MEVLSASQEEDFELKKDENYKTIDEKKSV